MQFFYENALRQGFHTLASIRDIENLFLTNFLVLDILRTIVG